MKGHVKIETVRQWLELLEDGQAHEVYCLMLAELELVGREDLAEVLEAQVPGLHLEEWGAAPESAEVDTELLAQAKEKIIQLNISQRKLAPLLGVTHPHLSYVLNGHRDSDRLLQKIEQLTAEDIPAELKGRKS